MNLKEYAEAYEPPKMGNIADLTKVGVDVDIELKKFKEGTEDEFEVHMAKVDGKDYRVPGSVLVTLKTLMGEFPHMKFFKVLKKGSGITTEYTVVPLGVN